MRFADFDLRPEILRALDDLGYEEPTPIQEGTIDALLRDKDMIGQAQTGSGKTAAFMLPILDRIEEDSTDLQALVLCREVRRVGAVHEGVDEGQGRADQPEAADHDRRAVGDLADRLGRRGAGRRHRADHRTDADRDSGRTWVRTRDFSRVRRALYR